ncbi:MAG: hypothetical protein QXP72_00850 [Desulfurococcaceae archaeon]
MSSIFRDQIVDNLISSIRKHGEKVFEISPEKAVENTMVELRNAGFMVKMIMKSKWKDIKALLENPVEVYERVREKDQEVYNILVKHKDWIESFTKKFRDELEKYLFG